MKDKIDTHALLRAVNIVDVVSRRIELKKRGAEHYGICPFHNDSKASLQVNESKQVYKCFACGAGGDAIDFLTRGGQTFQQAVEELGGKEGHFLPTKTTIPERPQQPKSQTILPVPDDAPEPSNKKKLQTSRGEEWARFIKRWAYRDAGGRLLGYTVRFEDNAGEKQVFPQTYVMSDDGKARWSWRGFPTPRPLYGLERLAKADPKTTVLLVEGEKTADAAVKLLPHVVAMCWIGGVDGVKHADWSPLQGRNVIIWPDNDTPGMKAAAMIAEQLSGIANVVKYIKPPAGTAKGWDLADADWKADQAREYAKANIVNEVPEPNYLEETPPPPPVVPSEPESDLLERPFFRFLGFEKIESGMVYVFFINSTKTVAKYSAGGLTKANLLQLVTDPTWWETNFPTKRGGFDQDMASSWLMNRSHQAGMFDPSHIRGRGAWMDGGRVVVHAGNSLIVDGQRVKLGDLQTDFTYEQANRIGFGLSEPLKADHGKRLLETLKLINWERPISPALLAGWCVVAPVCGALFWRPHIWLTGAAGTGKSWVMDNIVRPMLGETALAVQGDTTEAGLRQTLGMDALPVVFDEADTDDQRDNDRVQKVLALMRSSSTGTGAKIIKGSASGHSKEFEIRSCFVLGSIAVQAAKAADKSRITVLGIRRELDRERARSQFEQLEKEISRLLTPEFVAAMQARTVKLLPVILRNAKTCSDAVASVLGFRRTGDQLGTLIAGAYSLVSDKEMSFDQAKEWVMSHDWAEERGLDEQRDEQQLLSFLMEQIILCDGIHSKVSRTIGELIRSAANRDIDSDVPTHIAWTILNRYGFKMRGSITAPGSAFMVSNGAQWIKNSLSKTPWAHNHNKMLLRLEGAKASEGVERFAGGTVSRAVEIPLSYIV